MTGVVPVIPRFKFTDSSGVPISGGSVTIYLAGTTTLTTTYQDRELTTANENPVTLDANGECLFWLSSDFNYKFLLKDADGATVSGWPVDNIPGAADTAVAVAAATEAAEVAQEAAEAAAEEAEAARDSLLAAASIYADTTAGLAATSSGGYFWVPSAEDDEAYILYKDNAGVAEEVKRLPNAAAYTAVASQLDGLSANFTLLESDNIYDPDIADSANDGVYNTNGSTGSLARYHRSGLIAVTAGQSIVIDVTNTDSGWQIYQPGGTKIHGYAASPASQANLHSLITATFSQSDRLAIFTVPSGVNYIAWNTYKPSGSLPAAADYEAMRERTMVLVGGAQVDFEPYYPPYTYIPDETPIDETLPVKVTKVGNNIYIRQPFNDTYDVVRLAVLGVPSTSDITSTVFQATDFIGARKIAKDTSASGTVAAYAGAPTSDYMFNAVDNADPERLNGMYLGGNHGVAGSYALTKTGHGLTNTAVGDVGTDGAAKSWVLSRIIDANTIAVTAANTGVDANHWRIQGSITGTTITFATAGAYAFTASSSKQMYPVLQGYDTSLFMDGVEITEDGTYTGNMLEMREEYGICNPADWLATLIAEKGAASPKDPNNAAIDTQIEATRVWHFDHLSARVGYYDHKVIQPYSRSSGVSAYDYFGCQQWQQAYRATGNTLNMYIPDLAGTVGGYDFTAVANITSNSSDVPVSASDCADPTDPASHFAHIIKDGSSNPLFGFVHGYARHLGVGVPAVRAAKVTKIVRLSDSEKVYPTAVDYGGGTTAAAGEMFTIVTYDGFMDSAANPTHTVSKLVPFANGKTHWVLDIHETISGEWVVPFEPKWISLIGQPVTVINSTDMTVHSEVMTSKGLRVTTTGGYGRAVIEIG